MKLRYLLIAAVLTAGCSQQKNEDSALNEALQKDENMQQVATNNNTENASEAQTVVSGLIEAMRNKDAAKIRSSFAANASQSYGDGEAKSAEAFFSWLESDIIKRKGRVYNAEYAVDGNQVTVTGRYFSWFYTSKANFLFTVSDGKIINWQMRY